jgi:hypothetical protein
MHTPGVVALILTALARSIWVPDQHGLVSHAEEVVVAAPIRLISRRASEPVPPQPRAAT